MRQEGGMEAERLTPRAVVTAWLAAVPWLTVAELAALGGVPVPLVRHQLGSLARCQRVWSVRIDAPPWPGRAVYALRAAGEAVWPAQHRLLRLEVMRALVGLAIACLEPATAPRLPPAGLRLALGGEREGPPTAAQSSLLGGLADGWLWLGDRLVLLRWDDGVMSETQARRWLARLGDERLMALQPPVALVCQDAVTYQVWRVRLRQAAGVMPPGLVFGKAGDLANEREYWWDSQGHRAPTPLPRLMPEALSRLGRRRPGRARSVVPDLVAARLKIGSGGVAVVRLVASQGVAEAPHLPVALGLSVRQAQVAVQRAITSGLIQALPWVGRAIDHVGEVPSRHPRHLVLTPMGLQLVAALAGVRVAVYRRWMGRRLPVADQTPGAAIGEVEGGDRRMMPTWWLAQQRHTQGILLIGHHLRRSLVAADQWVRPFAGGVLALRWQGPLCPSLLVPAAATKLPVGGRGQESRQPAVRLYPDALADLYLAGGRVRLVIEWDSGRQGPARLARKLPRYVCWATQVPSSAAFVLFVTSGGQREKMLHRLWRRAARQLAIPTPPLWTTTRDWLGRVNLVTDPIWWTGRWARGRQVLRALTEVLTGLMG